VLPPRLAQVPPTQPSLSASASTRMPSGWFLLGLGRPGGNLLIPHHLSGLIDRTRMMARLGQRVPPLRLRGPARRRVEGGIAATLREANAQGRAIRASLWRDRPITATILCQPGTIATVSSTHRRAATSSPPAQPERDIRCSGRSSAGISTGMMSLTFGVRLDRLTPCPPARPAPTSPWSRANRSRPSATPTTRWRSPHTHTWISASARYR
jgi:hypothetical protein